MLAQCIVADANVENERWFEFIYLVLTTMPGESYRRRFTSVVVSLVSRAVLIPFVC